MPTFARVDKFSWTLTCFWLFCWPEFQSKPLMSVTCLQDAGREERWVGTLSYGDHVSLEFKDCSQTGRLVISVFWLLTTHNLRLFASLPVKLTQYDYDCNSFWNPRGDEGIRWKWTKTENELFFTQDHEGVGGDCTCGSICFWIMAISFKRVMSCRFAVPVTIFQQFWIWFLENTPAMNRFYPGKRRQVIMDWLVTDSYRGPRISPKEGKKGVTSLSLQLW